MKVQKIYTFHVHVERVIPGYSGTIFEEHFQ